ncbi:MAG: vitamin K epoxide reductase family protein [Candidatus Kryptonium sp.]|nr:vitamin K epoxide reductase family protein [Candidatus Kryptonium sp.]MDW8108918.1 vitamin K epoxide reductase family protein [Candidatus Kryptonium sp.]
MGTKISLVILSAIGFYISLYFTLIYFHLISPSKFLLPNVCKLSGSACETIINTKYARILGFPNFVYGLFYYLVIFLFAIFDFNSYIKITIALISWIVVVLGVYLIYALLKVLRVNCLLCFISHVINFLIAVLLSFQI